jgi:hypothetical protein
MTSPLTSQPDDTTGHDCYLNSAAPNDNNNNALILVGHAWPDGITYRGLIKFDLSSIPASATILSATLSIWVNGDYCINARTLRAYRVKRNWVEEEATWNVYSAGNNWGTAGCSNTTSDRDAADMGNVSVGAAVAVGTEIQIPLTAAEVQKMIDGTYTNYGWLLQVDTETGDEYAYDSSGSATPSERPKLVVTYVSGFVPKIIHF